MFYVYVLSSGKDNNRYFGYTKNLKLRFEHHFKGLVTSIKKQEATKVDILRGVFKSARCDSQGKISKNLSW